MKHGTALHISSLRVGDVVRPIRGGLVRTPGARALFVPEDQEAPEAHRRRIGSTEGWRCAPVGNPEDFRQGYDAMTVIRVTEDEVSFVRPYFHVNPDGTVGAVGLEQIEDVSRDHGGHWYELLQGNRA